MKFQKSIHNGKEKVGFFVLNFCFVGWIIQFFGSFEHAMQWVVVPNSKKMVEYYLIRSQHWQNEQMDKKLLLIFECVEV
jgi:hypothetical protein